MQPDKQGTHERGDHTPSLSSERGLPSPARGTGVGVKVRAAKGTMLRLVGSMTALAALGSTTVVASQCRAVSPPYTVALIELYTSQGCSSCPPADDWLSRLNMESPLRGIPLALHVGYWDYIGWKDPFARREFNDRQAWLSARSGGGSVYTPQVFVAGSELADWRQRERFGAALKSVLTRSPQANIELQAHWISAAAGDQTQQRLAVQVHWSADAAARNPQLLLAVKRSGYVTDVQAGENGGSRLHGDHVVRAWDGPFSPEHQPLTTEIRVPAADSADATLVAIAQDGNSGAVLQAVELPLAACETSGVPAAKTPPR